MIKSMNIAYRHKRLELILWSGRRGISLPESLFLAFAVAFLILVFADYSIKTRHLHTLEYLSRPHGASRIATAKVTPEELQAVNDLYGRLNFPWGPLFEALENAKTNGVVLLSLSPEPEKRLVTIIAQSDDVYSMLNYVRSLKRQAHLSGVTLHEHEVEEDTTDEPIKFTVTASWNE